MTEQARCPDSLQVWRQRAKESFSAFFGGRLHTDGEMTLALAVLRLPREDLAEWVPGLTHLLCMYDATVDPDACETLFRVSQVEGFDRVIALFDLVRALNRSWALLDEQPAQEA